MNSKNGFVKIFIAVFFTFSIIAEDRVITGVESNANPIGCYKLCKNEGKDQYGNIVTIQIPSTSIDKKETYEGSKKFACVPCGCGNGVLDFYEECDHAENNGINGCTIDCKIITSDCGNGEIDNSEDCDDGINNSNSKDSCRPTCQLPKCGDNIVDTGEECDLGNGNQNGLIGCDLSCKTILCGDNKISGAEICDDGNQDNNDECTNACVPAKCGDGYLKVGSEICDRTLFDSSVIKPSGMSDTVFNSKTCSPTCEVIYDKYCGDGIKNGSEICDTSDFTGLEQPDDMPDAIFNAKTCNSTCSVTYQSYCGDGIKNGNEVCDNSDFTGYIKPENISDAVFANKKCTSSCTVEYGTYCGDGIKNGSEKCEGTVFTGLIKPISMPAAIFNAKTCDPLTCLPVYPAYCGDGIKNGTETCDKNDFSNLVKPAGMPENTFNTKTCSSTCNVVYSPYCGDNIKSSNEKCDGTIFTGLTKPAGMPVTTFNAKTCDPLTCLPIYPAYCGDGIKNETEECDKTDFTNLVKPAGFSDAAFNSKKCSAKCEVVYGPYCGDGIKNGTEKCDGTSFTGLARPAGMPLAVFNSKTCDPVTCLPIYDPYCGDGSVNQETEACDKTVYGAGVIKPSVMPENIFTTKTCSGTCQVIYKPYCGDNVKNGKDICDGTDFTGLKKPAIVPQDIFDSKTCSATCTPVYQPFCGDGIVNNSEQCDDGDQNNIDDCSNTCELNSKCIYVAAWNNWSAKQSANTKGYKAGQSLAETKNNFEYSKTNPGIPSCFAKLGTIGSCGSKGTTDNSIIYGWCDKGGNLDGGDFTAYALAKFLGVPNAGSIRSHANGPVTFYMDENCKFVPKSNLAPGTKLCGFGGISWSPISLILDDKKSIEEEMTVVDFSLDPNHPEAHSLWKASETTPLLVYDPEKTGDVKSVSQLFGNWTFGGKPSTETLVSNQDSAKKVPWDNGYEALATLDRNSNLKIDGVELEDLALWFDKNRDAKVDDGELRSLTTEKITALYFDGKSSQGTKDIKAELGFERIIAGKTVKGSSLDWFAETFSSKKEASDALGIIINSNVEEKSLATNSWKNTPGEFTPHTVSDHSKDISGYWKWTMNDKHGEKHPGFFAIEQKEDGSVIGFTIVETKLAKNKQGVNSGVKIIPLEGSVTTTEEGIRISFKVESEELGGSAISTVILNKDGKTLSGNTTQRFMSNGKTPKSAEVEYEWTANKFINS